MHSKIETYLGMKLEELTQLHAIKSTPPEQRAELYMEMSDSEIAEHIEECYETIKECRELLNFALDDKIDFHSRCEIYEKIDHITKGVKSTTRNLDITTVIKTEK